MVQFLHGDAGDDNTTFLPNPAISWKVAFDFFGHTAGTTHSDVLSEAGHRRPRRLFSFSVSTAAELHRWETYLERRVEAKGWDGPMLRRTLRHLPKECASTSQMVSVESTPQCSHRFCQTGCSVSR